MLNVERLLGLLSPFARECLFSPSYRVAVLPEFVKDPDEKEIVGNLLTTVTMDATDRNPTGKGEKAATLLRFREDIITPMTAPAAEALAKLKRVLVGPAARERILDLTAESLPRGSIVLLDNGRWIHARNEVRDPKRHLRRVRWDKRPFVGASSTA